MLSYSKVYSFQDTFISYLHARNRVILVVIYTYYTSTSSESSLSYSRAVVELVHADPLHWPQAGEHCTPFLRQVHLIVRQSDKQLHLINCRRESGAGGRSVATGTN